MPVTRISKIFGILWRTSTLAASVCYGQNLSMFVTALGEAVQCRCYRLGMNRDKQNPITSARLKQVIALHKANLAAIMPKPKPAELAQDAGGGYNANGTFPQR